MATRKKLSGLVIVAMFISPGVAAGAAGWAIVNGKLVKIPPRGPANRQLTDAIQGLAGKATQR